MLELPKTLPTMSAVSIALLPGGATRQIIDVINDPAEFVDLHDLDRINLDVELFFESDLYFDERHRLYTQLAVQGRSIDNPIRRNLPYFEEETSQKVSHLLFREQAVQRRITSSTTIAPYDSSSCNRAEPNYAVD